MTGKELKQAGSGSKIILGGKEYEIALDFNAICELEEKYGSFEKAVDVLDKIGKDLKIPGAMKDIRFLLYLMLRHTDDNITEHEAGKLLTMQDLQKTLDSLGGAMSGSIGAGTEKNVESPQET